MPPTVLFNDDLQLSVLPGSEVDWGTSEDAIREFAVDHPWLV